MKAPREDRAARRRRRFTGMCSEDIPESDGGAGEYALLTLSIVNGVLARVVLPGGSDKAIE